MSSRLRYRWTGRELPCRTQQPAVFSPHGTGTVQAGAAPYAGDRTMSEIDAHSIMTSRTSEGHGCGAGISGPYTDAPNHANTSTTGRWIARGALRPAGTEPCGALPGTALSWIRGWTCNVAGGARVMSLFVLTDYGTRFCASVWRYWGPGSDRSWRSPASDTPWCTRAARGQMAGSWGSTANRRRVPPHPQGGASRQDCATDGFPECACGRPPDTLIKMDAVWNGMVTTDPTCTLGPDSPGMCHSGPAVGRRRPRGAASGPCPKKIFLAAKSGAGSAWKKPKL